MAAADAAQALFPPELAAFGRGLRSAADDPVPADLVPLPELLRPESLSGLVLRYGASLGGTHHRAVLSRWAQYYMLLLIPPAVARAAAGAPGPDLSLARSGVALSPVGAPLGIGLGAESDTVAPLTALLRSHLQPLADGLASGGLPAPVFWNNAGHVTAWTLRILRAPPAVLDGIGQALAEPRWADGGPNPFAPAMAAARCGARGVCCLRHRLPGLDRCSNCPVRPRATLPN